MLGDHDEFAAVYVISVAAEISGMHPQTLRQYDRLGLVSPGRASGRGRRYSIRDIALLREVQRLVNEGINLAGIKRILELETQVINLNRYPRPSRHCGSRGRLLPRWASSLGWLCWRRYLLRHLWVCDLSVNSARVGTHQHFLTQEFLSPAL